MNCDQVFDILTRGPFPTGTPCDSPVEAHLTECPQCRRLAEALRPALELFQEAVGPEESRDLPGYWCAVATDRQQPGVSCAEDVAQSRPVAVRGPRRAELRRRWNSLTVRRRLAVVALVVALASMVGSRGTFDGRSSLLAPAVAPAVVARPAPAGDGLLLAKARRIELPTVSEACFADRSAAARRDIPRRQRVLVEADLLTLDCCTGCHNANAVAMPKALATVSQSCQLCHRD